MTSKTTYAEMSKVFEHAALDYGARIQHLYGELFIRVYILAGVGWFVCTLNTGSA
jgi:hypothetical protein